MILINIYIPFTRLFMVDKNLNLGELQPEKLLMVWLPLYM
jgi:hypothetical protein